MIALHTSYYIDKNPQRQKEIDACIILNCKNALIDIIYVFTESAEYDILKHEKIVVLIDARRPTYQMYFDNINCVTGHSDINIVSNSDIFFNETLELLHQIDFNKKCIALSRWDIDSNGNIKLFDSKDSQDAWIFCGSVSPIKWASFCLGKPGCDNRIAYELTRSGYEVTNPARSLQAIHLHITGIRNYVSGVDVVPPPYHFISASAIIVNKNLGARKKLLYIGMPQPILVKSFSSEFDCTFIEWTSLKNKIHLLRQRIVNESNRIKPDFIFLHIQCEGIIDAITINKLHGKIINWTGDVRHPIPKWYYDLAPHLYSTCFSNETDVNEFIKSGARSDYLQIGFDDAIFTKVGAKGRANDIVFMGNNYDCFPLSKMRLEMVQLLRSKFPNKFFVYGSGYPFTTSSLMGKEASEASVYRSCRIAINISHFDYIRYSSDRIFRIMGSGAFCLTKHYPGIEKDFTDGVHLRVWNDFDELKKMIDYYLSHPDERMKIADAGCKHVMENHRWANRINDLKKILQWEQ